MKIIRKKVHEISLDSGFENQIIAAMGSFNKYALTVIPIYKPSYFEVDQSRLLMGWFIEFFNKYGHVVGDNLSSWIELKQKTVPDEDLGRVISQVQQLIELNIYEKNDVDYLIKETLNYFNRKKWAELKNTVDELFSRHKDDDAYEKINSFDLLTTDSAQLLTTDKAENVVELLDLDDKPLFEFPGALGELLNNDIVKGGFISLLAPEKTGKSYFLLDIAHRAARAGLNPLYVDAGDMNYSEILKRFICMVNKKAMHNHLPKFAPVLDCKYNANNECHLQKRKCNKSLELSCFNKKESDESIDYFNTTDEHVDIDKTLEKNPDYVPCSLCRNDTERFKGSVYWEKWKGDYLFNDELNTWWLDRAEKNKKTPLFLSKPAGTVSVGMLKNVFQSINYKYGFFPRVLIIDYADLMVPDTREKDTRAQINVVWRDLRAFALQYNMLIVTASQANSRSYNKKTLDITNFSEDKRKNAHVTAIWGLNRTASDRSQMVMRVNQILSRRSPVDSKKTVTVLQNLACATPIIANFYTGD